MAGFLILNPRSGRGGPSADEVAGAARALGATVHVLAPGDSPQDLARKAEADVLGVAGGDGSLAAVAEVAVERDLPFVCVPFGTRNHFARDAGIDRDDPLGALAAFRSEREVRIDVARANGRLFLNNVSLGLYARLVHRRESHRRRGHALARLRALWLVARERHPVALSVDGEGVRARAVLVANNAYELSVFDVGARERLDTGELHLYLADGVLPNAWDDRAGTRFVFERAGGLRAAVDGEPERFDSPLEVTIEPAALRLRLPERESG